MNLRGQQGHFAPIDEANAELGICEDSSTIDMAIFDASYDKLPQAMIVQITAEGIYVSVVTYKEHLGKDDEMGCYEVRALEKWAIDSTAPRINLGSISLLTSNLDLQTSKAKTTINCVVSCGPSVLLLSTSYSFQTQIIAIKEIWCISLRSECLFKFYFLTFASH